MAAAAPPAPAPTDPLIGYYQSIRQMNLELAQKRYKTEFRFRTQQYIRGRGTTATVDEEVCMGCTHCFDNCAFEAIDMVDRRFALPGLSYVSRKAIIIVDNCVGCEKCAIVCPVDAIDMITKFGWEVRDGKTVLTEAPPAPPSLAVELAERPGQRPPLRPPGGQRGPEGDLQQRVLMLHRAGFSTALIAGRVGAPVGEVELIISLEQRKGRA